jgi:hypothetical protein
MVAGATVEFNGRLTTLQYADCARRVRAGARRRTGLSGGPTCQSSNGRTLTVGWRGWRTGQCPVAHRTVRWPHMSELQRSNPNGWVTWLAHRTVSGGTPDCPVRPSTDNLPNGHFGGWGYKYPQPPHLKESKFSAYTFNTRASAFNTRHN